MRRSLKSLILLLLVIATIICYSIGNIMGVFVFLLLGCMFELAFWIGIFKMNYHQERNQ